MVTLICGSSSRGVTSTAKAPSSSATSASSGVICAAWKKRGDAAGDAQARCFMALRRQRMRAAACGSSADALAGRHAGQHLDAVAVGCGPGAPGAAAAGRRRRSRRRAVSSARRTTACAGTRQRASAPACRGGSQARANMPGVTPDRPAGRSRRSSSVWVAGSTVGSSCSCTGAIAAGAGAGQFGLDAQRRCQRAPARSAAPRRVTRRPPGRTASAAARPGIAMSPSTTATSATTPA